MKLWIVFITAGVVMAMIQITAIQYKLVKLEKNYEAFVDVVKEFDDAQAKNGFDVK